MYWFAACILIALFPTLVATRTVSRAFPGLNTTLLRLVHDNAINSSTHRYADTTERIALLVLIRSCCKVGRSAHSPRR